jgi:integrase
MSKHHFRASDYLDKPNKPYEDFPLFPHNNGCWAKKIRGKLHYFGVWADPDAALANYLAEKDALHAGRKPRPDPAALTVKDAANAFLNAKAALRDAGELSPRTWAGYKLASDEMVTHFGVSRLVSDLDPQDFESLRERMAKKWGYHRLSTTIQYVRSIFKYAFDAGLITTPVRVGPAFKKPSKKTMRVHRAEQGPRLFAAEEIRRLMDAAGTPMKAMILLGINAGFGNADCANLPRVALDLEQGVIDFPRPKTGIARRCVLWPETVAALREALARRPDPKDPAAHAGLVFITKYGLAWGKESTTNPVSQEMGKLLRKLHINGRNGLGFYTLRHTFRTVADEAKDQPAADFIMGHESPHMSTVYRERIGDERLKAVSDHVRRWLFGTL